MAKRIKTDGGWMILKAKVQTKKGMELNVKIPVKVDKVTARAITFYLDDERFPFYKCNREGVIAKRAEKILSIDHWQVPDMCKRWMMLKDALCDVCLGFPQTACHKCK